MVFQFDRNNVKELLERLQDDDIVEFRGADVKELLKGHNGETRGRKPIRIDTTLFDETVECWHKGEITAREAMKTLNLKPNTFYRRIKERTDNDMRDVKQDIIEAKNHLQGVVSEVKPLIEEKKQLLNIEHEMRSDRVEAKLEYVEDMISAKREVSREAKEFKDLNN